MELEASAGSSSSHIIRPFSVLQEQESQKLASEEAYHQLEYQEPTAPILPPLRRSRRWREGFSLDPGAEPKYIPRRIAQLLRYIRGPRPKAPLPGM